MKGKVLVILHPEFGHSTAHVRGLIYRDSFERNGWFVTFVSISPNDQNPEVNALRRRREDIIRIARDYDVIYLLKVNSYPFIKKLRASSKAKIVFDLTDALWRPNFRVAWWHLEEILQLSDAIFSENEYVCAYASQYNKKVFNLPACTQPEKFDALRSKGFNKKPNKVIIGWIGTEATVKAVFSILKPLERLQAKHPTMELRIVGAGNTKLDELLANVRFSCLPYYKEADMIREALSMDIGLFPAPGDLDDYRLRGPLKALIYMSAKVPVVCVNAGDPARLISDGDNGMLVNSEKEWEEKIDTLIRNPALRETMGRKGYEIVRQKHSLENAFRSLENALREVLMLENRQQPEPSSFKRFLIEAGKIKFIPGIIGNLAHKAIRKIAFKFRSRRIQIKR